MKRKIIIQVMIVVVSMCYVIGYSIAAEPRNEVSMKRHKTIRIKEKEGIIPQTVTLQPGATVKWVNLSLSEIKIDFLDEKVIDAADNPVHFFIGRENTFESHNICAGCTASLRFQEKGSFRYRVKESRTYHGGEKEFRGAMLLK
jgi:plastocyanin